MNKYKILTLLFLLVSIGVESKANTRSDDPSFWLTKEGQYLYNAGLIEAAKEGDTNKVTNLVRNLVKKDDIDVQDNQDRTPLHWASKNEHLEVVDVLLDNGASIDVLDNDGNSAAVLTKNSEIRKKISKAAEQDRLHAQLKEAIQQDNIKKVQKLLDKGANVYPRGNRFAVPEYMQTPNVGIQTILLSNTEGSPCRSEFKTLTN